MADTSPRCLIPGSINIDEIFRVKKIVRPGETSSSSGLEKRGGGKGANQAIAVARAGAHVDLVGAVGEDGKWLKEFLYASGVDVSGVDVIQEPTGRAIIQVADDGENSIILFKGANFASLPVPPARMVHPSTTHVLLQNEIPLETTLTYLDYALSPSLPRPVTTVFNPSPMLTSSQIRTFPWHKVNWLIVNEGEVSDLCKIFELDPQMSLPDSEMVAGTPLSRLSAYPLLLRLSKHISDTHIVCTLGAEGVLALVRFANDLEPIYLRAASLRGNIRDTTGAGDCFTGYFVAGLMRLQGGVLGRDNIVNILHRCVQAAGMCVEGHGAMDSIPLGEDVDTRLCL